MDNNKKYFDSPEFGRLLQRYERSLQMGKDEYFESDELSDIAEYYYDKKDKPRAEYVLDYAMRLHPGAVLPLVFKARIALIDEKNIEKARYYASLINDEYDIDCLYLKAEIMIAEDKPEEANSFLRNAMDNIDEDDVPDFVLDVATIFIDYGLPDISAKWLAMSDEDDLQDYREIKARIAFAKGDYEQSEQLFEQLLDEDPYSGRYWNSLASTQFMGNRINDSITSSEYSIAINPNDEEALLNKANGLFSLGNFNEALKFYERFHQLCPDEGAATMFIGNCLLNIGQTEKALEYYKKALEALKKQNLGTTEVLQCLAFTYSQLDQRDEALACIDEAMKQPDANKDEITIVRGHIQLEHGHVKEAIRCFLGALQSTSFSHDIFFRIAISVYDCGYPAIAYRMFKSYTDMHDNPGDEGMAYLAACLKTLNKKAEYLECLKTACQRNPAETKKVLGEFYPETLDPKDYYDYEVRLMADGHNK